MTISTEVNRVQISGDGVTTAISFPYYFLENADLLVILTDADGVETTQVLDTDYSVSGAGVIAGGTVTMTTAPAVGETVTVIRDPAPTQETDLTETGNLPAESLEMALDRTIMVDQRVKELAERSIRLSDGFVGDFSLTLPASLPAGSFLQVNADGDGFESSGGVDSSDPLSVPSGNGLLAKTATGIRAARTIQGESGVITVANGDGVSGDPTLSLAANGITGGKIADAFKSQGFRLINFGLKTSTNANTNDTLVICSADGTDFSASNPGYAVLPSASNPSQVEVFTVTANITMLFSGLLSHGDGADLTDERFYIYAINDAGSLKFGACPLYNLERILGTNDEATQNNCTALVDCFVTSALSGDAPAVMFARVEGDFTDSGDVWELDASAFRFMYREEPYWRDGGPLTVTGTTSDPSKGTTSVDQTWYLIDGENLSVRVEYRQTGAGSGGSGDYLFAVPKGLQFKSSKVNFYNTVEGPGAWTSDNAIGHGAIGGTAPSAGPVTAYDATNVRLFTVYDTSDGAAGSGYGTIASATAAYVMHYSAPISL